MKASGSKVSNKTGNDDMEDGESKYDEESPSGKAASLKKKKAKISEKRVSVVQEQGNWSATTTSSRGCT